jgi:predicted Zn-dependent peptidase
MRRRTAVILIIVIALAVAVPALGGVRRHKLSCGATLLTMPADWNRIVAVTAVVDAGSLHDPEKLPGLANLTRAMLLQGTTTRTAPELAELVDSAGLTIGTDISVDNITVYVTAIDSELDLALEVLADVLQHPAFDESRLIEEQRAVYDALAAQQDDPFTGPFEKLGEILFGKHPMGRMPHGTTKGISRITPAHLVKFHSQRYVGPGTVISVVGNFDEKDVVSRLDGLMSDYPSELPPTPQLPVVTFNEPKSTKIFKDVDESYIARGFLAPPADHPDFAAFEVMDAIIGLGSGSRLSRTLGEAGANVSDRHGAYCRCGQRVSAFVMYAATDDPDTALDLIDNELSSLMTEAVSEEELATAKNRMHGRHERQGQTNLVRAARLASYELAGLGFDFADSFLTAVNRVDKDDILRVASEWLTKPATVVVRPGKTAPTSRRKSAGI